MPFRFSRLAPPAAALVLGLSNLAAAQQTTPDTTVPEAPAPVQPNGGGSGGSTDPCAGQPSPDSGGTLTGQLSRCGGVLTPPPTGDDAGATVPDPDPGTTPVVPPEVVPDQAPNGRSDAPTNGG